MAPSGPSVLPAPDPLHALLASVWPRLHTAIPLAASLGADWAAMSRAFVHPPAGAPPLAHAGVLEIPMIIDGVATRVAGIHAVCTAAQARGQGHARRVLEPAIAWAQGWATTLLLHAVDPALYERFGFRAIEQWVFAADVVQPPRTRTLRLLDHRDRADVARVFAAFAGRVPVSQVLGIGEAAPLFVLDEVLACGGFGRLWWSEPLGCVVAATLEDRLLQLYDVVGPRWPALETLIAAFDGRVDRVEVFFAPDRWPEQRWTRRPCMPPDVLMVRGPFTDADVVVPPLARC